MLYFSDYIFLTVNSYLRQLFSKVACFSLTMTLLICQCSYRYKINVLGPEWVGYLYCMQSTVFDPGIPYGSPGNSRNDLSEGRA